MSVSSIVLAMKGDDRLGMINVGPGQIQLCTFVSNGRLFGVDILHVREVSSETRITPVPHAPKTVSGFVNLRGQVHLILDLRRIMGYPPITDPERCRLVLFKENVGQSFGLLVDEIGDIRIVAKDQILDRRQGEKRSPDGAIRRAERARMVRGVVMIDGGLILVLRAPELLARFKEL
jgi:chemotaxis signal transduction protein